ncbi:MAG: hypothetical protein Q8L13_20825 [Bradyrhizobium sp.]|uniref:hypothetical protein n=1 Tax=Bradyrhizobium sp. TaxID=376 RepID=UPI0027315A78|nr:hypothetical protein [Bradyrhizobium sp.]MDP1868767.1 hypothetical protein [Bradyrhizobium sp.]
MTRAELGRAVMQEFAERRGVADREWLASLLDRAIEVGHIEIKDRVAETWGRAASNIATKPEEWSDERPMRDLMPILMQPN